MTLTEYIDKWLHKEADFDGYYEGQCVDLVRYYIQDVLDYPQPYPTPKFTIRGAADFFENFDTVSALTEYYVKIPYTEDFIPQRGDIAIFDRNVGGGDGHISVVIDGQHNAFEFYSFDQNWTKKSFCEIVKHSYINLLGVLRPKNNIVIKEEEDMSEILKYLGFTQFGEVEQKRIAEHLGEKDGKCNWGAEGSKGGHLGSAREKLNNPPLPLPSLPPAKQQKIYKLTEEIGLVIIK